jgi:hypothetical protein
MLSNMHEGLFQMLGKLPKMSAREILIHLSGRPPAYGEQPRWLQQAAERFGISVRMARAIWNDEIKDPSHWAIKKVRREAELAEARREAATLAQQYQAIAGGMRVADENFYSTEIDRLERLARIIGGLDRS